MEAFLQRIRGFTQKAMEAALHAQEHAIRLRHSAIDTEHLLLGLLTTQNALALRILDRLGVTTEQVIAEVLAAAPKGEAKLDAEALMQGAVTNSFQRVLTHAREEGERLGCSPKHISTPYLLLGLLREESGIAAHALNQLGVELEAVRAIVAENPNE